MDQAEKPTEKVISIFYPTQTDTPTKTEEEEKEMLMTFQFEGIEPKEGTNENQKNSYENALVLLASQLATAFGDKEFVLDQLLISIAEYLAGKKQNREFIEHYGVEPNAAIELGNDLIAIRKKQKVSPTYPDYSLFMLDYCIGLTASPQYPLTIFMQSLDDALNLIQLYANITDTLMFATSMDNSVLRQHNQGGLKKMQAGVAHME